MKKLFNVVLLTLVFGVSFVVFFPKEKLYYYAQKKLLTYNITIESKRIESKAFCLDVEESFVLLSGSRVASIKELRISLFGMSFEDVRALGTFKSAVPVVKQIEVVYKPNEFAKIDGDFGEIIGVFDIGKKKIIFEAKVQQAVRNKYNMLFSNFKKVGERYVYEINL